jgi:hypothetical protein
MTKLIIVTDRRGKLIGAVQGHELSQKVGEVRAEVSFERGHKLHKVDVDIDLAEIIDPKELEKELARLVPKPARRPKARRARKKH